MLLVSADAALLESLEGCLQGSGLRVATSPDPEHGAVQARDLRPALIITDMKFDAPVPLMLVPKKVDLGRLRGQVDAFLNPAPPPAPKPFLGGGIRVSPPPRRGRRWVLLVNADPSLEAALDAALAGSGLHMTTASDPRHAAVQARELKPVLVVSDILTPDVLDELRRDPAAGRIPFIYVAAEGGTPSRDLLPSGDESVRGVSLPLVPETFKALAMQLMAAASGEAL